MTNYLDLTNKLLVRLRENKIEQTDFLLAKNVQELAKDAINAAIAMINLRETEWPFNANATLGSQTLTIDQEEYSFPANTKEVDWGSFHLVKSDVLGNSGRHLEFISREQRNRYLKDMDDVSTPDGRGSPIYVFSKQSLGFGISPSPDAAYTVTFEYWLYPTALVNYDDQPAIPALYDEVILQGALYHFYMSRDNSEQASKAEAKFDVLVDQMRTVLINKTDRMESTLINRRRPVGSIYVSDYFL